MTTAREEEIAKIDAELEKLGGDEETTVEELEEETEEEEAEGSEEEETKEPEAKEEPEKPIEAKLTVPEPQDNSAYARLRYEAAEAKRERDRIAQELAEARKPNKEEDPDGFFEAEIGATKQEIAELKAWKAQQEQERKQTEERDGAFRELAGYESEAAAVFADFEDASKYAKSMIAASIKLLEPNITQQDLAQKTLYKYAEHAALALNNKKHPGQAIYETAAQWGYKKPEEEKPKIVLENKPSLAKLAENKKKSSGMSNTGSSGKADIGNEDLFKMSNAQRMKLKPEDWARLEAEA